MVAAIIHPGNHILNIVLIDNKKFTMKTIKDYRSESILNKKFRFAEGIMSRREWLNMWRIKGAIVEEKRVRNYAAEEKLKDKIDWQRMNVPLGNHNYPSTKEYLENKAKLEAGIYKTEYRLLIPDNSLYDITKTEYEYFKNMELAEDLATQKQAMSAEEWEQQEREFAKKYF